MPDPLSEALELAYRHLNRRERTVSEMRGHLERRAVDPRVAQQAIDTLIEHRCLDDARYARMFVDDKRRLEQWGSERIERALLGHGVDPELIAEVLATHPEEPEIERALGVLRRRFPAPPREIRERDRALGVLLRKGYETEIALDALAAYARGD